MSKAKQWNERFALIDRYKPTDEQIVQTFGINQTELETARQLQRVGTITASSTFDTSHNPFSATSETSDTVTSTKKSEVTIKVPSTKPILKSSDETQVAPETATQRLSSPKKRGRKGTKISEAFRSIPPTPISVDDFAKRWNVSIPVLRQSKRFDTSPELGRVIVKVNKENGNLEIWRESVAS